MHFVRNGEVNCKFLNVRLHLFEKIGHADLLGPGIKIPTQETKSALQKFLSQADLIIIHLAKFDCKVMIFQCDFSEIEAVSESKFNLDQ